MYRVTYTTTLWINSKNREHADQLKEIVETALLETFPETDVKVGKTFLNTRFRNTKDYAARITIKIVSLENLDQRSIEAS